MTLARLWVLHFLWLVPLAALALLASAGRRRKAMERFAEPPLLARIAGEEQPRGRFAKAVLLLGAMGLILFALAGPRWGSHYQEVTRKGVDIMLLMDVSQSMLVEDVQPNRLERARREALDLLRILQGDRIGLVVFSGAAYLQCPLTLDYGAFELFLSQLQPDLVPVPGTDLGAALNTGLSSFDPKSETDKVVLLITDGEDNEQRGLEAARRAAAKGVRVFGLGVGETSGGPVPASDGSRGFKKDRQGKVVLSRLHQDSLSQIASTTGGTYVRSSTGALDLDTLYFRGIKATTKAQTLTSAKLRVYEERFPIFVLAALAFLLIESLIVERKTVTGLPGRLSDYG